MLPSLLKLPVYPRTFYTTLQLFKSKSNPWFSYTIGAFRTTLRHAESIYKRTHSALHWSKFKSLRNHYHHLILDAKKQYFSELLSSSSDNPRRLWQTVNKLLNRKSASLLPIVVPYELYDWEKFRNFMELYEFYALLDNVSALYGWACSTQHVPTLAALSE